ncbi:restriction endonuclease subunit S, partial [Halovibrio sp. HP20-50]|uniref:restriction endonuclease subunit S n=1 Tax=Halovibrio sp. HP20-59 TaxID=3080275 RepID=UPI00294B404D
MREGWKTCNLGDVCTLQRGFDLPKKNRRSGHIPLMSSSGAIDFHNEVKVIGPGVVTGRSGSIGNVFYVEGAFWPLNTTLYVKDFHGNHPRFIYYLLSSFNLKRFSTGAGVPTLNRNNVHCETVNIPRSVEEQKLIASIIDEAFDSIDAAIANTEKNLANAKELFESYLNGILGPVDVLRDSIGRIGANSQNTGSDTN